MSSNHLRGIVITIGILFLLICALIFSIYLSRRSSSPSSLTPNSTSTSSSVTLNSTPNEACPRPAVYSSNYDFDFTKTPNETQNLHANVDYFRFSLSWSPTFCLNAMMKHHFQCQHSFGLIVHGLWPSSRTGPPPRNCRNEPMISLDLIRKYFCLMPSETLMQGEWEKHGTCHWHRAEDYFHQIQELYSNIQIPDNLQTILNDPTLNKAARFQALKQSFLTKNPQIPPQAIEIQLKSQGKLLREVAFCYDLHFSYTNC